MPKKKKSKKKKKGGKKKKEDANNSKKEELSQLKLKIQSLTQETEMAINNAENTVQELDALKFMCKKKAEKLNRQHGVYDAELTADEERHDMQYLKDRFTIKELTEKSRILESQAYAARQIELENQQLRERVALLTRAISDQAQQHGETIHSLNCDKFVVRDRLEKGYRKALRDAYAKQKSDAYRSLDTLSRKALDLNGRLKQEMALREKGLKRLDKEDAKNHSNIRTMRYRFNNMRTMGKQQMNSLALLQRASSQYKLQKGAYQDEVNRRMDAMEDIKLMIAAAKKQKTELFREQDRKQKQILQLRNRQRALQRRLGPRAKREGKGAVKGTVKGTVVIAAEETLETFAANEEAENQNENERKEGDREAEGGGEFPRVQSELAPGANIIYTDETVRKSPPSFKRRMSAGKRSVSSRVTASTASSEVDFATRFFVP